VSGTISPAAGTPLLAAYPLIIVRFEKWPYADTKKSTEKAIRPINTRMSKFSSGCAEWISTY
jgi:hypothetical protein